MVPVRGRVLLDEEPLPFGSVMFQPPTGLPARGIIQPDGSFVLSTYQPGDGAVVGLHKVRITCFESQGPQSAGAEDRELPAGKSLIPQHYNHYGTSGLEEEVHVDRTEPFVFRLTVEE